MSTVIRAKSQTRIATRIAGLLCVGVSVFGADAAMAQFTVSPSGGLPPPGTPLLIQSGLFDPAFLPPGYEDGVDLSVDFFTSPPTALGWKIFETDEDDCLTGRPPNLPPSATDPQPLGATLSNITASPTTKLNWPAEMSAVGIGKHCLAVEGCNISGTCRVRYVYLDVNTNPPFPATPSPRAFSMHAVTAVEGSDEPVAIRLFAENMAITPPVTNSDVCVKRCPQFPSGTANCNSSCGVTPSWVAFEGDTNTWTFRPGFGDRGPWEFTYTHPDLDTQVPSMVVDVIPSSRTRPRVKEALWAADFGGPYRIPLEGFFREKEEINDDLNTAPYFDKGYLSGEILPAGDVDAFIFHVGTNEFHRFTMRRSGIAPTCVFPAEIKIFDITDRTPTTTLASVMATETPVATDVAVGANGCAFIDTLALDNQQIYLFTVEHRDGAAGYDYVVHHEVFAEEVEDDENQSSYSPSLRAEPLFQPGVIGSFSSASDYDWGWVHLQTGNRLELILSRDDGSCSDLESATISITADDGSTLYEDDGDTGSSFITNVDGCPEGSVVVPPFSGGDILEARYNIAVTGAVGTYRLGIERRLNGIPNPPPSFEADLLDINGEANAIRPGTCAAVQSFLLDDYAEGASYFGAFISPLGGASLACDGFGILETAGGDVAIAPDAYGVCRPLFGIPLNDPQEEEWVLKRTQFGTLVYTDRPDAKPVQVLAMAADLPPLAGNAGGLAGGEPTILQVSEAGGEYGNDFYYDPYGECDFQTYPSPVCKGDAANFDQPPGLPNFCRLNAPKRFREGQEISFEMTRWNRSVVNPVENPVTVEVLQCDGGSCSVESPSVEPTYDFANDILAWDIPYDLLDSGGGLREIRVRLSYKPGEFGDEGGVGPPATYEFQFFVEDLDDPGELERDLSVTTIRLAEPLARVDLDTRVIHRAFQSTGRSAARHASNTGYFQFATNTSVSRTVGFQDRIQLHPQFENGRLTQGSGPPEFEILLRNRGSDTSPEGDANVYLVDATVDAFGNFSSEPPNGETDAIRRLAFPSLDTGDGIAIPFKVPTRDLIGVAGSEPWIAASKAIYIIADVDGDEHPSNNLFGPVYVTPARPPQACKGCLGDPSGGFAGAYSSSKDITGVIASMTPESPQSGDLVTVNVQVQFSGTGFTDDGVIRFYVDQETAPLSTTTPHDSAPFPTSPTAGTIYGYTFSFTADKPISGVNELPIRVYLDATNLYSEPGSGESNNQLPTNGSAEKVPVANSLPTFPSIPPTEAIEDLLWSYEVQVADDDAVDFDRIGVALTGPPDMVFSDVLVTCSGFPSRKCVVIEWVPVHGDGGDHPVVVEACDGDPVAGGDGGCSTQEFTVTVVEVDDVPVFGDDSPPIDGTEDVAYGYVLTATDEESATLNWTLVDGPSGLLLTPAGDTLSATIAWTPSDSGVGAKSVQVRVEDQTGQSELLAWTITTANVNDAPVLEGAGGSDLIASEGSLYSVSFDITDVDNSEASQGQTFDCSDSTGPAFLSFSTVGSTCVASGTPGNTDTGDHSISIIVNDDGAPSEGDTTGYVLAVSDAVNATPALAAVATQAATQDTLFSLDIDVTDDDFDSPGYSESITFTLDGAVTDPTGIVLTNNTTSVNLAWTPGNDDVGSNTVKVVATDVRGASSSRTFLVNVGNVNDDPVLTTPSNALLSEGGTYSNTLAASDPDGDTLTFSLVSGAPPGFSVSTDGSMTSGVTDDAQVGVWTVTVQAADGNGGTDQQAFTLTVNNVEEAPTFAALADDDATEDAAYARTIVAFDPDPGDSVTFAFSGSVPAGMTIGATSGEISWDSPTDDDVGVINIAVIVTDENANDVTRDFDLTIANTNDAPTVTSTAPTATAEGVAFTYTLVADDDDIDSGDSLTYSATTLPSWLTFNTSTRILSGLPDDAEVGDHSVVLRVEDEAAAFETQSFTLTVTAVNDAPILTTIGGEVVDGSPLAFTVNEGDTLNIGVLATDVDSATLTYAVDLDGETFDAFSVNASTGDIAFTPTFDEAGTYLVYIEVTDDGLLSDTEPVSVEVVDVNRAPVFAWTPDTTATEDVAHSDTATASDPDGESITYSLPVRPTGMTIGSTSGVIAYAPDNDDVGNQSVTVRATDARGLFSDESFTLVVSNVNDAPTFVSAAVLLVEEESTYSYVANATDDDGDALTYSAPTLPSWLTFTPATRTLTGIGDDDEVGIHSVVLRVIDGNGGIDNQAFDVTVTQKNDAPTLVAPTPSGTVSASEGVAVGLTIAATDPDSATLTYSIVGLPSGATLNATSGIFAWTPSFDDAGSYPMTLRASDGTLTASRAITISVTNTNRPPVVSAPSTESVDEGATLSFAVSASDPDGDSVSIALESGPAGATFDGTTLSWTPGFADAGSVDLTFRATANGQTADATTTVTVNHVNQPPILGAPSSTSATQDASYSSDLVAVDVDLVSGDVLTFTLDTAPSGMAVSKVNTDTARLAWVPSAAQIGTFSVVVRATDNDGETDTRAFDVVVSNVNDAPVITSSPPTAGTQGSGYAYLLTAIDLDSGLGDVVTFSAPTLPSWLTFDAATGGLSGTPANADVGTHPVVLRAQDTAGLFDLDSFSIVVANVNDAPTIAEVSNQSVAEGDTVSFVVVATDVDGVGPSLIATGVPAGASFSTSTTGDTTTGTFSWVTTASDEGTYPVSFSASDGALSDDESVTITVGNVNRPPTLATVGDRLMNEGETLSFTVTGSDPDGGDVVTLSAVGGAPSPFDLGATFTPATGLFTWTPGFDAAATYLITFAATDGTLTDSEVVSVTVSNVNRAPVFGAPTPSGTVDGAEDDALAFSVAATDADGDPVTLAIVGTPTGATFTAATGAFSWTPSFSQAGTYAIDLQASDGTTTTTRTLTLDIANLDRAPVLTAPTTAAVNEGQTVSFAVTATDPDGDTPVLALISGPTGATFVGGTFSWTPGFDEGTTEVATFRATSGGEFVESSTTITISNTNRSPLLGAPSTVAATQDALFSATLNATDADLATANSDTLTFGLVAGPSGASVSPVSSTQVQLTWTPGPLDVNPATRSFTVRVTDGAGATSDQTFDVTIANVNDAPIFDPVADITVDEGVSVSTTLQVTDLDLDAGLADILSFSVVSGPPLLTVDGATGVVSWADTDDQVGTFSVTIRVQDAAAASDTVTFNVIVNNVQEAPVFDSTPVTSATQGSAYAYVAVASDVDPGLGGNVTLSAPTMPSWLNFAPATGALSGTPENDDVGSHSVVLTATDGTNRTANQAFTVVVANVNDAPTITPIPPQSVAEGQTLSFAVSASDIDNDPVTVTLSSTTIPSGATFDGVNFSWTTAFDDSGSFSATFTASDGSLTTDAVVTITVGGTNRAPVLAAIADQVSSEGSAVSLAFDATDPDADPLTFSVVAVGNPDIIDAGADFNDVTNTLSWTPAFDAAGVYEVLVSVTDGSASDAQTFFLTIDDVNQAPAFTSVPPTETNEDAVFAYGATAVDGDGDVLVFSLTEAPSGMVIDSDSGAIEWTPENDDVGTADVTVRCDDGRGGVTLQAFSLTVTNVNDAPVFESTPVVGATEDSEYNYVVAASDEDLGSTVTLSAPTLPTWLSFAPATGVLSGVPDDGDIGVHAVSILASDETGATANQDFNVTVTESNDAPTFIAPTPSGTVTVAEGNALLFTVAATDPDGPTLSYRATGLPTGAALDPVSGDFVWTPPFSAAGNYPITLIADDSLTIGTRALVIEVVATDRPPTVSAPATVAATEGELTAFTVVAEDADGDAVTLTSTALPNGATFDTQSGAFAWTPDFESAGSVEITFTVTAAGQTASATSVVTVANTNRLPILTAAPLASATEDTLYSFLATADDPDGDAVTISLTAGPTNASFDEATATLTWTPLGTQVGTRSFALRLSDGNNGIVTETFDVTVSPQNDAPTFASLPITDATEDVDYFYDADGFDEDGDTLTFQLAEGPTGMTLDDATGELRWTPDNDAVGDHTVRLVVSDPSGLDSEQAFTLSVENVNDAPRFVSGPGIDPTPFNVFILEGATFSWTPDVDDDDNGDSVTLSLLGAPAGMTLVAGTVSWTPTSSDVGQVTFRVRAEDENGAITDVVVTIDIGNLNDAPFFLSDAIDETTEEDVLWTRSVLADDIDGDTITFTLLNAPAGMTIEDDGGYSQLAFVPQDADVGVHDFIVRASDGNGGATDQPARLVVSAVNDAPVLAAIANQSAQVDVAFGLTLQLATPDVDGPTTTFNLDTGPAGASVTGAQLSWTPTAAQVGSFDFVVSVTDGEFTDTEQFAIVVGGGGLPPSIVMPPDAAVDEGRLLSEPILISATDGGDPTVTLVGLPDGAVFEEGVGQFTWVPTFAQSGVYDVEVTAANTNGSTTKNWRITVRDVNRPPSLVQQSGEFAATEGLVFSDNVGASDLDGDDLSYIIIDGPDGLTIDSDGQFTWTPTFGQLGVHALVVVVSDGRGGQTSGSYTVRVEFLDIDVDSMPDSYEVAVGLDPTIDDSDGNPDSDGLSNLEEFREGTDPFVSDAPAAATLLSPAAGARVATATPSLTFAPGTDPNGFALSHRVVIRDTATGIVAFQADVADAASATSVDVDEALDEGGVYEWFVLASSFGGARSSEVRTFIVDAVNEAPPAPTLVSPVDESTVATTIPTLRAFAGVDPENESTHVVFALRLTQDGPPSIVTEPVPAGVAGGEVTVEVPELLQDGSVWLWNAYAVDSRGLASEVSGTRRFTVDLGNSPPPAPVLLSPAEGEVVSTPPLELVATASEDPEGLLVTTILELSRNASFADAIVVETTNVSNGEVREVFDEADLPLSPDGVWYWRATATDGATYSAPSTASFVIDFVDEAPSPPSLVAPEDNTLVFGTTVELRANASIDPEGAPVAHRFDLLNGEGTTVIASQDEVFDIDDGSADLIVVASFDDLESGGLYAWRVVASDGVNDDVESPTFRFRVDATNERPAAPVLLAPADGDVVDVARPTFIFAEAEDLDGDEVTHDLEIWFGETLAYRTENRRADDGEISVTPPMALANGDYLWRARGRDTIGGGTWAERTLSVDVVEEDAGPSDGGIVDGGDIDGGVEPDAGDVDGGPGPESDPEPEGPIVVQFPGDDKDPSPSGCTCGTTSPPDAAALGLFLFGLTLAGWRRRRRQCK